MGHPTTPRTDALFGVFLQDIREIRQKHPKSFGNKYCRFDYAGTTGEGYSLFIEPDTIPKTVKREIMQAFMLRLNQDSVKNYHHKTKKNERSDGDRKKGEGSQW